jgi:O-antigen/teichoic acid export membrane protein
VVQVVTLVSTAMIARMLAPSDYGLVALSTLWIYALTLIADLGLGTAIVQFQDVGEDELNACFWLTLGTSGVMALLLWAAAPTIAAQFDTPMLSSILRVLSLTLPLTTLKVVPEALLRTRLELDRLSQANIVMAIVTVPVVFSMARAGFGVWALVAGVITTNMVQVLATFWFAAWWPGFRMGGRRLREMLKYGLATLGSRICLTLYQDVADIVILGKVAGAATVGFYSMAKQLATLPAEKIGVVVNQIASPVMAGFQEDHAALRDTFFRGTRVVAWITFPMCVGLMLLGRDLVELALTAKWRSLTPILYPLCVFSMIRSVDMLFTSVLLARYRARALFRYQVMLVVTMPIGFWAGSVLGGGLGAAMAWVVIYPVVVFLMARVALSAMDASWSALAAELWPPAVATLGLVAAVLAAKWWLPVWPGESALAKLMLTGILAVVAYGAALTKLGGPMRTEIRQAVGWFFRPGILLQPAK